MESWKKLCITKQYNLFRSKTLILIILQFIWTAYTGSHWLNYCALKYIKADDMECCSHSAVPYRKVVTCSKFIFRLFYKYIFANYLTSFYMEFIYCEYNHTKYVTAHHVWRFSLSIHCTKTMSNVSLDAYEVCILHHTLRVGLYCELNIFYNKNKFTFSFYRSFHRK